jgi:small subunit ribosomal protein S4
MGDPRKLRNKFARPKKLWDVDRVAHDKGLRIEYGLKNTSELWRAAAELKKYRREARRLQALPEEDRKADSEKILKKLARMGVLKKGNDVADVLALDVKVILERRLQTIVQRKGLARTMKQSRQLITHGFVSMNGRRVTRPGVMVNLEEESSIRYTKPIDISVRPEEDDEPPKEEAPAPKEKAPAPKEETAPKETPKEEKAEAPAEKAEKPEAA